MEFYGILRLKKISKKVLIFKIRRKYRITVNYALKTVLRWTFTWITTEKFG